MLFGTEFDVLDATRGRNQTTKGMNLSVNVESQAIIIDIEGTDSIVRGENGAAFEHMSALFALAVSDVLMVNMWTSELGRYKAAAVGLLSTIFEVNLKLFTKEGKKRILFVLRDFNDAQNNLTALKQQISQTMQDIWAKISKPPSHALLTVFDCFEFDFKTVAVKDFKEREFLDDIHDLKSRFTDPVRHDYLFRGLETDIPIDGINLYYQEIWNLITSEKDLNIPTQKEMLANLRCNELKNEALQLLRQNIETLQKQANRKLVPDFSAQCEKAIEESLALYDEHGSGYYTEIYATIRDELSKLMFDELKDLFNSQIRCLVSDCQQKLKASLNDRISKVKASSNYCEEIRAISKEVFDFYDSQVTHILLEGSNWSHEEFRAELEKDLKERVELEKEKQLSLLAQELKTALSGKFSQNLAKAAEHGEDETLWENIHQIQLDAIGPLDARVEEVLNGLEKSTHEIEEYLHNLRTQVYETIQAKVKKFITRLTEHVNKKFNMLFNKDERGIPRDWAKTDIEKVFTEAREKALIVLEAFKYFKVARDPKMFKCKIYTVHSTDISYEELLDDTEYEQVLERIQKNAEMAYKEAMHMKEYGPSRGFSWMYMLLFLILGWNEILWLLSSPFILYPLLFALSVVALMFSMGLGEVPKFFIKQILGRINTFGLF